MLEYFVSWTVWFYLDTWVCTKIYELWLNFSIVRWQSSSKKIKLLYREVGYGFCLKSLRLLPSVKYTLELSSLLPWSIRIHWNAYLSSLLPSSSHLSSLLPSGVGIHWSSAHCSPPVLEYVSSHLRSLLPKQSLSSCSLPFSSCVGRASRIIFIKTKGYRLQW